MVCSLFLSTLLTFRFSTLTLIVGYNFLYSTRKQMGLSGCFARGFVCLLEGCLGCCINCNFSGVTNWSIVKDEELISCVVFLPDRDMIVDQSLVLFMLKPHFVRTSNLLICSLFLNILLTFRFSILLCSLPGAVFFVVWLEKIQLWVLIKSKVTSNQGISNNTVPIHGSVGASYVMELGCEQLWSLPRKQKFSCFNHHLSVVYIININDLL